MLSLSNRCKQHRKFKVSAEDEHVVVIRKKDTTPRVVFKDTPEVEVEECLQRRDTLVERQKWRELNVRMLR